MCVNAIIIIHAGYEYSNLIMKKCYSASMLFHISKTWADQVRLLRNVIDDTATLGMMVLIQLECNNTRARPDILVADYLVWTVIPVIGTM